MAKENPVTKKDIKDLLEIQTQKVEGMFDVQTKKVDTMLIAQTKKVEGMLDTQTQKVEGMLDVHTKDIQNLLVEQTNVILGAVDERISAVRIDMVNLEMRIDKKLEAMEERWNKKFDKLITTLDHFLKRMTDMEDEFTIMRHDLNRMKKVIKEKLGVEL